ncbi:MAG: DMT family transporter [Chitinophagia bacterium]|nr:DMT family transporter [Chitinophagia bacterium]
MSEKNHINYHKQELSGILLALVAVIIWGGNFVIARGVNKQITPISLAFYRWTLATFLLFPIAYRSFLAERKLIVRNLPNLLFAALFGISLFNTLVYVAGHYTTAINLALIGTTSSPIMSTILAYFFLKEKPGPFRITGMILCFIGILWLLSRGNWHNLAQFHFSKGDLWVLGGAFCFAVYNILFRKKSPEISPYAYLFTIFGIGSLFLLPAWLFELQQGVSVQFTNSLLITILYLGAGTSVISFLCWNASIEKIGIGRTVLFGNLIPIISSFEAVLWLGESLTIHHWISGIWVTIGLLLANISPSKLKNFINNLFRSRIK